MVIEISSVAAFEEAMTLSEHHLVVIDFFATWCRPCVMIAPAYQQLSEELPDVKFFKVNVDTLSVVARREAIRAMPTFKFYRHGVCEETIQGGNLQLARATIDRLRPPPPLLQEVLEFASGDRTDEMKEAGEILLRIADNVLREPLNPKFRRLKVGNRIVTEKLLPVDGAMQCLVAMGFHDADDAFVLDPEAPLDRLRLVRSQVDKIVKQGLGCVGETGAGSSREQDSPDPPRAASPVPPPALSPSPSPQPAPTASPMSTEAFLRSLKRSIDLMAVYERPELQQKARRAMKWEDLSAHVDVADTRALVGELLRWFKNDFFSWMDAPSCTVCGERCSTAGTAAPSLEEAEGWAGIVELYQCPQHHGVHRFPRYNHPGRLLDTRTGRCGEWANAFTLCLRAAGVRSRFVHDWTDHVWCEVFLKGRWTHCDPCENTLDKPLAYEVGWGKKLTYIIAFSHDDIQDVTWRYTRQPKEVLARRREVSEAWLVHTLVQLRRSLQASVTQTEQVLRAQETLTELVEFLTPPREAADEELSGRQSGSAEWRKQRGEMGHVISGKVIKPLKEELDTRKLELRYSTSLDEYQRLTAPEDSPERVKKGWTSCMESATNIDRKHERDWKMVYLARMEGSPAGEEGTISWTIDLAGTGRCVSVVKVMTHGAEYESGRTQFSVCGDGNRCVPVRGFFSDENGFRGCHKITVTAVLSGGNGALAWQHAQLFRQKDSDRVLFPLNIIIEMDEDEAVTQ